MNKYLISYLWYFKNVLIMYFFTGLLSVLMSLIKLDNHLLLSFISFLAQLSIIGRMICHNWKIGLVWIAAVIIGIELPFHFFNPSKNNPSGKPHCTKFNSFFLTGQKINSIPVQLGQFFKYNPVGGWTPNFKLCVRNSYNITDFSNDTNIQLFMEREFSVVSLE